MISYAHPIEGTDPKEWCHEPSKPQKRQVKAEGAEEPDREIAEPEQTTAVAEPAKLSGGIPKTTEELYDYIARMMKWKDSKPARSWIVNKIRIEEARIDSEPEGCYYEIKELMGW